jgi:hypothetical protein
MQGKEVYSLHRPMKASKKESVVLSFLKEDARGVVMPYYDALVVTVIVANHAIYRILVDNGSSVNILYWPAFQQMGIEQTESNHLVLLSLDLAESRSIL